MKKNKKQIDTWGSINQSIIDDTFIDSFTEISNSKNAKKIMPAYIKEAKIQPTKIRSTTKK